MQRILATVLLSSLFLAGCQSYGGNGAEEAIQGQIEAAVERLSDDLARLSADANGLANAAVADAELKAFEPAMEALLADGAALLARQRDAAEQAMSISDYRTLQRELGSMITGQHTLRARYQELLRDMRGDQLQASMPVALVPAFYARIRRMLENVAMRDVLRRPA